MANSDFYYGAYPAEYSNSLSGIFDMKMQMAILRILHMLFN